MEFVKSMPLIHVQGNFGFSSAVSQDFQISQEKIKLLSDLSTWPKTPILKLRVDPPAILDPWSVCSMYSVYTLDTAGARSAGWVWSQLRLDTALSIPS